MCKRKGVQMVQCKLSRLMGEVYKEKGKIDCCFLSLTGNFGFFFNACPFSFGIEIIGQLKVYFSYERQQIYRISLHR